jgi:hypothetical protein
MSFLIAALTTAVEIGWKAVIAAEVLSQPDFAIGTNLQLSKIYLQTKRSHPVKIKKTFNIEMEQASRNLQDDAISAIKKEILLEFKN